MYFELQTLFFSQRNDR